MVERLFSIFQTFHAVGTMQKLLTQGVKFVDGRVIQPNFFVHYAGSNERVTQLRCHFCTYKSTRGIGCLVLKVVRQLVDRLKCFFEVIGDLLL